MSQYGIQTNPLGYWQGACDLPFQPQKNPMWLDYQKMLSDPQSYRIAKLEQQVAALKARIAELEAGPYHGDWAAG